VGLVRLLGDADDYPCFGAPELAQYVLARCSTPNILWWTAIKVGNKMMPLKAKKLIVAFATVFLVTGISAIYISLFNEAKDSFIAKLTIPLFGLHMACWMVCGIVAKHVWDVYKTDPAKITIDPMRMIGPLVISPMVFYPIYSLWATKNNDILFILNLMAFQNGFFWQTVFDAARPAALPPGGAPTQDKEPKRDKV
jgi:hypothetical protein